jgi:hypothetical protein
MVVRSSSYQGLLGLVFVKWRVRKTIQQSGEESGVLYDSSYGWDIMACWGWRLTCSVE